ncbi:hypothetical protein ABT026_12580 [Streptomyces sp. NPDC002734]|uniref:hypothetical protein n=1 Tax=Streptomyces sp. NPDC002734 TaxID=3154426 RepID=UPI00332DCC70
MTQTVEIDIERLVGTTLTVLAAPAEPAVVTGAAEGTGEADGTGAVHGGGAVRSLVRERLDGAAEGRGALEEFEARPSDPAARQRLGAALAGAVYADPAFRQALTDELTRTAAVGPASEAKPSRRSRRAVLIPAALVVALGLTAYGVLGTAGGDEPALKPVTSVKAADAIVPDSSVVLVAGWDLGPREVQTKRPKKGSYDPPLFGGVAYLGPAYHVTVSMGFFEDEDEAVDAFAHDDMDWMDDRDGRATALVADPPKMGDESMARVYSVPVREATAAVVRVGTVVCRVSSDYAYDDAHSDGVFAFARMCAKRAEQAQRGQEVDAEVEGLS